jgi:hypothetical protein
MKQEITDELFEVVVSLRFASSYTSEFIREFINSFVGDLSSVQFIRPS